MDAHITVLHLRLANCLETILELEKDLGRLRLGQVLLSEFGQLKSFMERIDEVNLSEEDVRRIEKATSSFLEELRGPLGLARQGEPERRPLH